ncbi:MAG TPA: FAD:protein FMN transferase [Candidatus Binatia bacterium]|nr:FAD:protein FMN transferase [Candidatus Binatia bacterium]
MRANKIIMGTGVSLDVPGANQSLIDAVFTRLEDIDARFSTYKKSSDVSRFKTGEIAEKDFSQEMKQVFAACKSAEAQTNGYFSAWASGSYDPSGYVKGWAIAEAAKVIKKAGHGTYCIGIGGDILAASDGDKVWKIAIEDPRAKNEILAVAEVKNMAVATSGNYRRGAHIINPKNRQPADEILSITVAGPEIIDADVLATAGFARGFDGLNAIAEWAKDYRALMIDKTGRLFMTENMQQLLVKD